MDDLLKEIAQSPAVIKEVYGDLAKPGVQQVGKALSTIIGLGNTMLWPLALMNEKAKIALESNLERYRNKLKDTLPDEVCEVPPEIGVPIAEKLSYVTNEELSEMYTELLANASQINKANVAHPSFVNVINNISPDEAILIKSIKGNAGHPIYRGTPKTQDQERMDHHQRDDARFELLSGAPLPRQHPCIYKQLGRFGGSADQTGYFYGR